MGLKKRYFSKVSELLRLALPVMLAQLGYIAVQVADSAMVGMYGGEDALPLAAVSFGTSISWLFLFLCIGITIGITPVIGITLPFFSYGGSSMATMFAAMGLVSGTLFKPKPQHFSLMY